MCPGWGKRNIAQMTLKTLNLFLWWGRKLRCVTGTASKQWIREIIWWHGSHTLCQPILSSYLYILDLSPAPKYTLCSASAVALLPHIVTGWESRKGFAYTDKYCQQLSNLSLQILGGFIHYSYSVWFLAFDIL